MGDKSSKPRKQHFPIPLFRKEPEDQHAQGRDAAQFVLGMAGSERLIQHHHHFVKPYRIVWPPLDAPFLLVHVRQ